MNNIIIGSNYQVYKNSNETINSFIKQSQEKIDLASYLKASDNDKYSTDNPHVFIKQVITQFPDSLKKDIEKCKMGFLAAINHVWISTGSVLFLWNYVENSDIFRYDCSELIENVEIIKISNHFELVISTPKYIFLHGIDQTNPKKIKLISSNDTYSDGVIMSDFITTDTRRVFMRGNDGHLYELIVISGTNGLSTSCKIYCHTSNPILKYTSYFFRSLPKAGVKSMVVDNEEKFLYLLLSDSSIHSVNIQGSSYLPTQRYNGTNLESIHLISKTESEKINLMAISNKGDRLYFSCKNKNIDLIHSRSAPPLPGSLLFNSFTNESCELSYYNHGILAAILKKSEKKYLFFTAANSIRDANSNPVFVEDVYNEPVSKKIWSIIEDSSKESLHNHYFKENLELPESPTRQFSALSTTGITHYTKQRSVDYLASVLRSNDPNDLLNFLHRFGAVEACAISFLLACSTKSIPEAIQFIRDSDYKDEGLLLHFSRVVENIWAVDVMQKHIPKEAFIEAYKRLDSLILLLQSDINVKSETIDLIVRAFGGISFIAFIHEQGWDKICSSLSSTSTSCTFSDLVTTQEGAILLREIILTAIKNSTEGNPSNNYIYISEYLDSNCSHLLGETNIIYYKGAECLQAVHNFKDDARALREPINYFKQIIQLIDVSTLQSLCDEYCKLQKHNEAIELAFAKFQTNTAPDSDIYDIIFTVIADTFQYNTQDENYSKSVTETTLQLSHDEQYHYTIYNWLMDKDHKSMLVTLNTPLLVKYITTQLPPSESLACLCNYHEYREEYRSAMNCLVELATMIPDITLDARVTCLRKACTYLPNILDMSVEEKDALEFTCNEAAIQLDLYNALLVKETTKSTAKEIESSLLPAETLLYQYAYKYDLYEEALYLINLLEHFDYSYVKKAWNYIIQECKSEDDIKQKVLGLAKGLYPSITSFPVYTIYGILEKHHASHSDTLLEQAGVPEQVIKDAKKALLNQ